MYRLTFPLTRAFTVATFLGAVALAGPAFAADATEVPAATAGPTGDHGKAFSPDRVEKRIAALHGKLRISSAQEPQWKVVAQAMRDNAKTMEALIMDRSAHAKTMTAVDDLLSYEKIAEAHDSGLKAFIPLFQSLYDGMSVEQKASADAAFRGHGPHGKH